ncbi:unnamed protein product [Cuscuta campestris]|uniref:C2H2-type domain-containing protein n=1 Tax=Cuscuta campestris TaxID=132261 RepID=A0A484MAU5_9ASTE|nr:unnamed protein product [Cuscuta campestris]
MPAAVWFVLKRSFHCKFSRGDAHDPNTSGKKPTPRRRRAAAAAAATRKVKNRSGYSKPNNLQVFAKKYAASSEFVTQNPPLKKRVGAHVRGGRSQWSGTPSRKGIIKSNGKLRGLICHTCGEMLSELEAMESHHLSKHAVTELVKGDWSRNIIEIICTRRSNHSKHATLIHRVLKVHNTQRRLADFEDYRETVKARSDKLPRKHARCLADGNERLGFHGAAVECDLGGSSSGGSCESSRCGVCRILRQGFAINGGAAGVAAASTSGGALEGVKVGEGRRKAVMVCRLIAGRVHRAIESVEEIGCGKSLGFDSLSAGLKTSTCSVVLEDDEEEDLILLSPKALLPCFIVIYNAAA